MGCIEQIFGEMGIHDLSATQALSSSDYECVLAGV